MAEQDLKKIFPLSHKYDQKWVIKNSLGENVLFNAELLTNCMEIKKGMRILDLACGKAVSSIFLAKEFGARVWAVDSFVPVTENYERIIKAGCEASVFPLQCDARELPFPEEFFDVIIVIDSYMYFGTDEKYLPYLIRYLKINGQIGIADICFSKEIKSYLEAPSFLRKNYQQRWYYIHSLEWWHTQWQKTGLVKNVKAEIMPYNLLLRKEYAKHHQKGKEDEFSRAFKEDKDIFISFFRMYANRSEKDVYLEKYEK